MLMRTAGLTTHGDGRVHDVLRDQLVALVPPAARIVAQGWRPWASASFAGARHWFDIRPDSDADAAGLAKLLATREWPMTGCFVADVALNIEDMSGSDWRVEILAVDN